MERVNVQTAKPYEVLIENGILGAAGREAAGAVSGRRVLLVSDDHVAPLYLDRAEQSFQAAGFRTGSFVFPAGEGSKRLSVVEQALEEANRMELTRADLFCALGGGVVGDLTGLAAALFQRGVDFIQIPTTLLAMVDASVGGKTAVNLESGKNLCGAFHQPRLVLCDPETLNTLPRPVFAEGMAEVIKHAAICDPEMLELIRAGADPAGLIARNVRIKSAIVSEDETEKGKRQLLNLGHTFGHAVEKLTGYTIYHGEGVSIGLMIAAWTARQRGLCPPGVYEELRGLLLAAGLPVTTPFCALEIAENAANDKKRKADRLTIVLPVERGRSELFSLPAAELRDWIACCDGEVTGR